MRQPDAQCHKRKPLPVLVLMDFGMIASSLIFVAVGVKMDGAVRVTMNVDVHLVPGQPVDHPRSQEDEHHPDDKLQARGEPSADGLSKQDCNAGEAEQRYGMTNAPCDTMSNDAMGALFFARNARDRRQVIRFEGMLHTDQKPKREYGKHSTLVW